MYSLLQKTQNGPEFGLFFDIDGVIVRGREVLSGAKKAFQLLTDKDNKFWVPTVFVTNAGNCLRQKKANQLSNWLDMEVIYDIYYIYTQQCMSNYYWYYINYTIN